MDRRRLLLILAIFVAVIGTGLVFLYAKGANDRAQSQYDTTDVLKATADIPAGTSLDSAVAAGTIALAPVPQNQVETGSLTTTDALKGKVAAVSIFNGQQVLTGQVGSTAQDPGTSLPIPKGMVAISVNLTDTDRVAGNIDNGAHVAIFVTGSLTAAPGSGSTTPAASTQFTRLLLPDVAVLNVGSPVPVTSTTTDTTGAQTTETLPRTLFTLAVTQKEAQKVILASKQLNLTFALRTSSSKVAPGPGTSLLATSLFR